MRKNNHSSAPSSFGKWMRRIGKLGRAVAFAMALVGIWEKTGIQAGDKKQHKQGFYESTLKRPLDFGLSLVALLLLWPVLIVLMILVRIKMGSPVFFRQERPGLHGRVFSMYKFRTMTDARDAEGNLLPDEDRLPAFGRLLRSTSLDELPELWNILKGDMAIVGPRPLLVRYLPRYTARQARRHEVRPGFTGLAQVHGRNALSWEEKFDWDVKYVDHVSFLGDLKILFDTVRVVLKKEGISSETSATMEEFWGTETPEKQPE